MNENYAPIALFVYNRAELTRNTLQCLRRNKEAEESLLYIFCDGPKLGASAEQHRQIEETRLVIREQQWCGEVKIIESEKNKGLASSIIAGVTKVVEEHGKVIVLEDDLSLSKYFLKYMNDSLSVYEDEDDILAVHAYLYPLHIPDNYEEDTFFIHDPGSLGWGTWKRAWKLFEADAEKAKRQLQEKKLKRNFNYWGAYPFMRQLQQQIDGKVDSWAIRWRATAYLHNKLVLYPVHSLVRHEGNVPDATHHHKDFDFLDTQLWQEPIDVRKIRVTCNDLMEKVFSGYLRKYAGMTFKGKVKNRLKKLFKQ